ncbi:unnamed protein product [Schistosoma mattheei]|uniref:Uncharacterized protein n=1 Tax=Schistosoma mattheei TaxID=31246 RepID=A0A183P829_9TREM|nr:unnamed protein product [Schistosoma mattheei]
MFSVLGAVKSKTSIIISAVIFFLSAVLIIIACTFTFFWLQRLVSFVSFEFYCLFPYSLLYMVIRLL